MKSSKQGIRVGSIFLAALLLAPSALARGPIPLKIADSPDNNLELALQAIQSARHSLLVNMYEFTSSEVADAIEAKIQAGVQVEILQEGKPVGGISPVGRGIESRLVDAMRARSRGGDQYWEMRPSTRGKRRYRFDHAKYMVIDGSALWIASENFSPNGLPTPGSTGNRGWGAFIQNAGLAAQFTKTFNNDVNPSYGDIYSLLDDGAIPSLSEGHVAGHGRTAYFDFTPSYGSQGQGGHPVAISADSIESFTSPDTSENGLVTMLRGARHSIDLELMTFYIDWKTSARRSPMLDEITAAARRGVKVRVLLNDDAIYGTHQNGVGGDVTCDPAEEECDQPGIIWGASGQGSAASPRPLKNHEMVQELQSIAAREHLPIEAHIANLKAMRVSLIHNKGAIIDEAHVLISSINWNENSVMNNRESAVLIDSKEAADYFLPYFDHDWQVSGGTNGQGGRYTHRESAELDAVSGNAPAIQCPAQVMADIAVGQIDRDETIDPSFEELGGAKFTLHFTLSHDHADGSKECILEEDGANANGSTLRNRKRFLQLKAESDGSLLMNVEGYTSSGKLYSVRSRLQDTTDWSGNHRAGLYDASGARPLRIAAASLDLN